MSYIKCFQDISILYKDALKSLNKIIPSKPLNYKEKIAETNLLIKVKLKANDEIHFCNFALELNAYKRDIKGDLKHFYIPDDNLCCFFEITKIHNRESVLSYIYKINIYDRAFAIHTHNESYVISIGHFKNVNMIYVRTSNMYYAFCPEQLDEDNTDNLKIFNFVCNFLLYKECFPECISDEIPKDACSGQKKNAVSIKTSQKIIVNKDSSGRIVSPYFKKGFFRHYPEDSTWFKNCKGQVRWIEPTFCKGKAYTVNNILQDK